jgi:hypothetical protein
MGWLPGYPGAGQEHRWQTGFVHNPVNRLDAVFRVAAAVALDLIQRGEVRGQWVMPGVLPKMSIGALACHLGRQVVRAAEVLPLESADAHYHRAAWVMSASPDGPPNDRSTDDAQAALGAGTRAHLQAAAGESGAFGHAPQPVRPSRAPVQGALTLRKQAAPDIVDVPHRSTGQSS